ncbi:hypothetical protein [Streptomyces sp. NPDC002851]
MALSLLSGCTEGKSSSRPLPEETPRPTASRTPDAAHDEALAVYRAMWRDLVAVSAAPDPESPRLNDHAMDGALELMKYGLRKAKKDKVVTKGTPVLAPEVVSGTEAQVVLRDCVDGRKWLQYKANGELKNDVPGTHFATDATVRLRDGEWRVSDLYMHGAGSC